MKATIGIKNFKKVEDLTSEFKSGNLYIIAGANNVGKTSVCQAIIAACKAENKNKDIVTHGKKSGEVVIELDKETNIIGPEGDIYTIKFDFSNDKEDKFSIYLPDASMKKNKTDIRNILKYNPYTVEDWFGWGLTAEGRRKQAAVIMELLPKDVVKQLEDIDKQINSKDGTLYFKRQGKNDMLRGLKAAPVAPITSEERDNLALREQAIAQFDALKLEFDDMEKVMLNGSDTRERASALKMTIENESGLITEYEKQIQALQEKINAKKLVIEQCTDKLSNIEVVEFDAVKYNEYKTRLDRGSVFISSLNTINEKLIKHNEYTKSLLDIEEQCKSLDDQIETLRASKSTIMASSSMKIDNVIIEDNELFFVKDDVKLPFTEDSLSYSVGGKKVIQILLEINKTLPIICVGKAAEYDDAALNDIIKLAQQYDAIIFADKVTFSEDPLHIEVVEPKKPIIKSLI